MQKSANNQLNEEQEKQLQTLINHALDRRDMSAADCYNYLNDGGWKKMSGRTERQLILQLADFHMESVKGDVVVTKNQKGQIVAVTRQDSEGRVLSVISTSENVSE